jgi:hypothetical protein
MGPCCTKLPTHRYHVAFLVRFRPFFDIIEKLYTVFEVVGAVGKIIKLDVHGVAYRLPVGTTVWKSAQKQHPTQQSPYKAQISIGVSDRHSYIAIHLSISKTNSASVYKRSSLLILF